MSIASSISGGGHPPSLPPSGAAGGDLSGTYPNPAVVNDSHSHTQSTLPPIPIVVYKSADETVNNSAALQNDNHLTTPTLGAGKKFLIQIEAAFTDDTAAFAGGLKASIGGTATYTSFIVAAVVFDANNNEIPFHARWTAPGQTVEETAYELPALQITGSVAIDAAGTLLLQWSQSAAAPGNLTALKGATLTYQEIV